MEKRYFVFGIVFLFSVASTTALELIDDIFLVGVVFIALFSWLLCQEKPPSLFTSLLLLLLFSVTIVGTVGFTHGDFHIPEIFFVPLVAFAVFASTYLFWKFFSFIVSRFGVAHVFQFFAVLTLAMLAMVMYYVGEDKKTTIESAREAVTNQMYEAEIERLISDKKFYVSPHALAGRGGAVSFRNTLDYSAKFSVDISADYSSAEGILPADLELKYREGEIHLAPNESRKHMFGISQTEAAKGKQGRIDYHVSVYANDELYASDVVTVFVVPLE